jgi:hypothetical protein
MMMINNNTNVIKFLFICSLTQHPKTNYKVSKSYRNKHKAQNKAIHNI